MKVATGFLGVTMVLASGTMAWAQAEAPVSKIVTEPEEKTFYLANTNQQNESNEIVIAVRNMVDPSAKIYLVPSQNAIVMRSTPENLALAQKLISDLDRPKKVYRLTYAITEIDGGKRVGTQHIAMVVAGGQRTVMKQGSKVPIVTGSTTEGNSTQSQVTYLDVGLNFDATLDESVNGVRLKTKVEQMSLAEERSGVGLQDPVIRQTTVEGTSILTEGKPLILGSIDIPGTTRHLDIDVVMEVVR
jgi:type II secretory pathway component GspD/PulD (secretin)